MSTQAQDGRAERLPRLTAWGQDRGGWWRRECGCSATPVASEFLEYDTPIVGNGVLERGGIVAQAGELVVVYNAMPGLNFTVYGYEE